MGWGNDFYDLVPLNNNDFISISGGVYHTLGLKSDGSLENWGYNYSYGLDNVPSGNDFVAISAGGTTYSEHALAIRADASIAAWGSNTDGQTDVPIGNDFVAVSAGGYHSLAMKSDGSLVAWGSNYLGQCDVPEGYFTDISAGGFFNLALTPEPASLVFLGLGSLVLRKRNQK